VNAIENEYLDPKATARMVKRSEGTLANDRLYQRGLPYIKDRGKILYSIEDIREYLNARKIKPQD